MEVVTEGLKDGTFGGWAGATNGIVKEELSGKFLDEFAGLDNNGTDGESFNIKMCQYELMHYYDLRPSLRQVYYDGYENRPFIQSFAPESSPSVAHTGQAH